MDEEEIEKRRKKQRRRYPRNWARISKRIRFRRADGRCEWCGMPHGARVWVGAEGCWRGQDGQWHDARGKRLPGPLPWPREVWWKHVIRSGGHPPEVRESEAILQTAHLDHNPANCDEANLAALCQFCHATYDGDQRKWAGGVTRDLRRGQRVLFS